MIKSSEMFKSKNYIYVHTYVQAYISTQLIPLHLS